MKILIGLDPRNLHTSMPWELARQLQAAGAELHWVFGGESRLADHYINNSNSLAYPDDPQHLTNAGRILFHTGESVFGWARFAARLWRLNPAHYDLVLLRCGTVMTRLFRLRQFQTITLGSWSEDTPVDGLALPPIIDTRLRAHYVEHPYTLVFLPGKSMQETNAILDRVEDRKFVVYTHDHQACDQRDISVRRFEHVRFRQDLCRASAVICQPEFGLIAECLHMGIPLLVEPESGRREQQETALTLHEAGLVHSTRKLTPMLISLWLDSAPRAPVLRWPDVSRLIIEAIKDGNQVYESLCDTSISLWNNLPIQLGKK